MRLIDSATHEPNSWELGRNDFFRLETTADVYGTFWRLRHQPAPDGDRLDLAVRAFLRVGAPGDVS